MNLDETREALRKIFEDKLSIVYAKIFNGEYETPGDSSVARHAVEDVILEYLDCGGTIESGSNFAFVEKALKQGGFYIERLGVRDFLKSEDGVEGGLTYGEAVLRNSKLTLEEMRKILDRRYRPYFGYRGGDVDNRLKYMSEFVQCGGILQLNGLFYTDEIEEIKGNPEYLKLYQEIYAKSKDNLSARNKEKEKEDVKEAGAGGFVSPEVEAEVNSWLNGENTPLKKREEQLSALEAEAQTITEAENLIDKQQGQQQE